MKQDKFLKISAALALAGAAAVLLDAFFLEKYFFDVKFYDIGNKGSNKKIKLALLTDLHFKHSLLPHHRKLAEKLNQIKPDLILIAGDTLDSTGSMEPVKSFFSLLNQSIKKVGIPGNNDYKASADIDTLEQVLQKYNCDFLVNESKAYTLQGTKIMVTGLDDLIEGKSNFKIAVEGIGNEEHHFLLIHSPLLQETVKTEIVNINKERSQSDKLNIQYIFAGHTHGGQIRLPGYVPVLPGKSGRYVNGWYNDHPPYLYVSKGFGTSTLPLRLFARSEVTIFNYYL